MGAHDATRILSGTKKEMIEKWNRMIEDDLYENGHGAYTGGIGTMGRGISKFWDFDCRTQEEAYNKLLEEHEKWTPAMAVRFRPDDGRDLWLVGGWAAC